MALRGSPAPHWTERNPAAASAASRLAPVFDVASGFWVLPSGGSPSGAFVNDPGGSGFTVIDDTLISGLRPTLLPSGMVVIY